MVVYDNLSAGHARAIDAINRHVTPPTPVTLVTGDVLDRDHVRRVLDEHRVEAVLHFAAWLSVSDSVKDPKGYYRNNVIGTLSLLDAMVEAKVSRLVFSSTCAVFGEPDRTPITEETPRAPVNAYGQSKLAIEHALPHYDRAYALRSIALRYFNAAGTDPDGVIGEDHDPETHIIPRAIDAALGAEPLSLFGDDYPTPDGTCLRDYVHVTDLADAHIRALRALEAGADSTIYNLGNGEPHSVRQVIDTVERVTGLTVPRHLAPRRPGDPAVLYSSNEKIKRELGWQPAFGSLDQIVETAWRWRREGPRVPGSRVKVP